MDQVKLWVVILGVWIAEFVQKQISSLPTSSDDLTKSTMWIKVLQFFWSLDSLGSAKLALACGRWGWKRSGLQCTSFWTSSEVHREEPPNKGWGTALEITQERIRIQPGFKWNENQLLPLLLVILCLSSQVLERRFDRTNLNPSAQHCCCLAYPSSAPSCLSLCRWYQKHFELTYTYPTIPSYCRVFFSGFMFQKVTLSGWPSLPNLKIKQNTKGSNY